MRIASSSAELRAAASLRAASFAEYSDADRSEYSYQVAPSPCCILDSGMHAPEACQAALQHRCATLQAYRRMKADAEWDVLEAKVAGTDVSFKVQSLLQHA